MAGSPNMIAALADIVGSYRAVFCDVWGVLHNGQKSFAEAASALADARRRGTAVILITNAPRPSPPIVKQLASLGVPTDAWDRIVTSGDVTRELVANGPRKILHIGPERDFVLYEGVDVELVEEFEAQGVVCTGFYEEREDEAPEDYADLLRRLRARDLPFICANPDIVVERGETLIWCAGALARDYGQLGGRTLIAGKPYRPIYDAALQAAREVLGEKIGREAVLAIGDGVLTDVKGAESYGIDVLYVSGGIHAREYGEEVFQPDRERLSAFLEKHGHHPVAVIPRLC